MTAVRSVTPSLTAHANRDSPPRVNFDPRARYRLCQKLDLKCDSAGGVVVWLPALREFVPLAVDALLLLTAFGEPRTLSEACEALGVECDDEVFEAMPDYLAQGLLLRAEDDPPPLGSVPVIFDRIASVDLPVLDLAATVRFYRDGLGAWVANRGPDVTVRLGETELALREVPAVVPTRIRVEAKHCEFGAAVARLESHGAIGKVESVDDRRVFRCADPSGHGVEVVQKTLRTSGTLTEITALQVGGGAPTATPRHRRDRLPSWVLPLRGPGVGVGGNLGLWARWEQDYDGSREEQEHLPWFTRHFDPDFAEALSLWAPLPGTFIEVGCGPGTHAARLASLGYQVTAVDNVPLRVRQAEAMYGAHNPRLKYSVVDVLDLAQVQALGVFDYALDRACYHVMRNAETRRRYVESCARLLRPGGRLFLKAMSELEPAGWGPSREAADEVAAVFSPRFRVVEQLVTSLSTTLTHQPKALLCVLERREAWEERLLEEERDEPTSGAP